MALRTNSKEARQAIRHYVEGCVRDMELDTTDETFEGRCAFLLNGMRRRFNRTFYPTDYDLIDAEVNGGGVWTPGTWDRALLIAGWLHETEEEAERHYERGKVDELFTRLVSREIIEAAR